MAVLVQQTGKARRRAIATLFHSRCSSSLPRVELDNPQVTYGEQKTSDLLLAATIFTACKSHALVRLGSRILTTACASPTSLVSASMLAMTRQTAFNHFCGGETLEECVGRAAALQAQGIRCIIDWSTEEINDPSAWDAHAKHKVDILQTVAAAMGSDVSFMPIKLTSLISPTLLERMTATMQAGAKQATDGLTDAQQTLLDEALARVGTLCHEANKCGIPLLLDAEQSHRQQAVHHIATELMRRFNRDGRVVLFDTIQMYLKDSPQRVETSLEVARTEGFVYAVKLVRGAYWEQERHSGKVFTSKEETDLAYDAAVDKLLRAKETSTSIIIATHNRHSIQQACNGLDKLGIPRSSSRVHFAQILGWMGSEEPAAPASERGHDSHCFITTLT